MDLKHGVVGRNSLEADIAVPASRRKPTDIAQLVREAAAFLLLLTADDADLVAQFTALLRQRVDMKSGRFWLQKVSAGSKNGQIGK